MFGPLLWGTSGWIFPLLAALMCLGFFLVIFRFAGFGCGGRCMGDHRATHRQDAAETHE